METYGMVHYEIINTKYMQEQLSVTQLKEKLVTAQDEIVSILSQLQEETGISVTGLIVYSNQIEVARDTDLQLKIEYDL